MITSFQALVEEEGVRTADARSRLGKIVPLSLHGMALLNTSVAGIAPGEGLLAAFMFAMQKCVGLAYLSFVRGHTVQGQFNCRQAIEYTALLAHLSACPDTDVLELSADGMAEFRDRQKASATAYAWLAKNEPALSEQLKALKADINDSTAHASAYTSHFTVDPGTWDEAAQSFGGTFFDASPFTKRALTC